MFRFCAILAEMETGLVPVLERDKFAGFQEVQLQAGGRFNGRNFRRLKSQAKVSWALTRQVAAQKGWKQMEPRVLGW